MSWICHFLDGYRLLLEVATRNRKRDGESGCPSRADASAWARLPSLLKPRRSPGPGPSWPAGREQVGSWLLRTGLLRQRPRSASSSPMLPGEALLPIAPRHGRRCLVRGSDPEVEGSKSLLRWDDAGPWEFWLKADVPDDAGKAYAIAGELRRDEERMAMETPLLLLGGGLVFWEDRTHRSSTSTPSAWMYSCERRGKFPSPPGRSGVPRGIAPAAGPAPARPAGGPAA